jgi:hypothetical protein
VDTVVLLFTGGSGGGNPYSGVIRDASGNLYGTTNNYNLNSVVYRLTPSGSGWTETTLYNFAWPEDPQGGVILDPAGNLFGTTLDSAYELMPSGGQWNYNLLHSFPGPARANLPDPTLRCSLA